MARPGCFIRNACYGSLLRDHRRGALYAFGTARPVPAGSPRRGQRADALAPALGDAIHPAMVEPGLGRRCDALDDPASRLEVEGGPFLGVGRAAPDFLGYGSAAPTPSDLHPRRTVAGGEPRRRGRCHASWRELRL